MTRSAGALRRSQRLDATLEVLAAVASPPSRSNEPLIAIRPFEVGRLASAGAVEGQIVERPRTLIEEPLMRELSADALVIDLSRVRIREPGLVWFLPRVRTRRLAAGCPGGASRPA